MNITIEKKEIITKINLNLQLENEEIKIFESILNLAEHEAYSRYTGGNSVFEKEKDMISSLKKKLK